MDLDYRKGLLGRAGECMGVCTAEAWRNILSSKHKAHMRKTPVKTSHLGNPGPCAPVCHACLRSMSYRVL